MEQTIEEYYNQNHVFTVKEFKYLDLFDNIPYVWVSNLNDEDEIRIKIIDLPNKKQNQMTTQFSFRLTNPKNSISRFFSIKLKYTPDSFIAQYLIKINEPKICEECESDDE